MNNGANQMYHFDHIREYYRSRAMAISGGASNQDGLRVKYWLEIAKMNSMRLLSGGLY